MSSPIRVVGAVFAKGNRFLACRKAPGKSLAGQWEFPGGKIELGETPEQALAREIKEELSVTATVGDKVTTTVYEYDFATIELTTFLCTIESGDLALSDHDASRWVSPSEAQELDWAPADIPAVKLVSSRL
ncbi:(deoxy)nucleoside triphosphate pyrophosphohydrolase [Corynebacterium sp. HMSC074H12]|uniref:(deoxy)nucleoside triphosphate pyrophosphohydrolase n=1 Tax=Corynebacterium sp. HMSC074H12 TaxID=1739436 RepID=UPI0008B578F1|nr:(deoxy)nucleoside triphosphate pyrophosphohydrolase [Corynebacterium sp. HMSC074H12]OFQ53379.1 hydrolase [Corynebacterium sp. HMSC074H12]